jgi:hypothetical protein
MAGRPPVLKGIDDVVVPLFCWVFASQLQNRQELGTGNQIISHKQTGLNFGKWINFLYYASRQIEIIDMVTADHWHTT